MTNPGPWTVELFEDARVGCPYERFVNNLDDATFAALDAAVQHVLTRNGIDLCKTEWMKPLGSGLYEFRVRHDAAEIAARFGASGPAAALRRTPILLRVFCHFHGNKMVLLLGGYDKGRDPSKRRQQREIQQARKNLMTWLQQRRGQTDRDQV